MTEQEKKDRLVKELREEFGVDIAPGFLISNEEMLRVTEGTLWRARIELRLALSDLFRDIKRSLPKFLRKLMRLKEEEELGDED